jgi:DNA-binding response OmpR family regulator
LAARKILLVDDAGTLLLLEQAVLHSAGFQIVAARDGEAGVRAALAHRPDLILLEALLPKRDASEICRQLRSHSATRDVPILLLVPAGAEENVERGLLSGCNGCIIKPIDNSQLLSRFRTLPGD